MTALTDNTQASTYVSHDTNSYHCKCNHIRAITHATPLEVHINSDTQNNWKCTSTQTFEQLFSFHTILNTITVARVQPNNKKGCIYMCTLTKYESAELFVCCKKKTHYQNPPKLMSIRSCFIRSSMWFGR